MLDGENRAVGESKFLRFWLVHGAASAARRILRSRDLRFRIERAVDVMALRYVYRLSVARLPSGTLRIEQAGGLIVALKLTDHAEFHRPVFAFRPRNLDGQPAVDPDYPEAVLRILEGQIVDGDMRLQAHPARPHREARTRPNSQNNCTQDG